MVERLKLFPRYLINMGLLKGLFVFIQVEMFSFSKVSVPGYRHIIFLRQGTSDRQVFREIFLFRAYAFTIKKIPKVIVDGGANVGLSSIYFANRFREATILAVEPEATNLEVLKKNVQHYPQIKIVESALWNADTFLRIKNKGENKWAFSVEECTVKEPGAFVGISVKTLMNKNGIQKIDLLKLDIESAEKELFEGRTDEWIPKVGQIVIELHDWMKPGCSSSFFAAIAKHKISVSIHEGMLLVTNNEIE
jgi:FkbM family methyltransferase